MSEKLSEEFKEHISWYRRSVEEGVNPETLYSELMRQCDKLKSKLGQLIDEPDERIANLQAAYEKKIQGLLSEVRALRDWKAVNARKFVRSELKTDMFRRQLKGLHKRVRFLREKKHNWRTYNGTDATLPRENVECVVWPEWKQRNNLAPVELNLYHENGAWITEEDERIDSVHTGDKWIPWKELWV